ncbi:type I-E CRISPR-associated protein Cas5/CasD [Actinokineospora sp. NBRC 105648]|uniref:type I-E CRISPR-associated protein Cas5/CasD n=1 Tax=Actinokineospora sp. NBRC 105648 TaxID=3032206 RepID=UPI0024A114FE|nr:type I-E CRISPR-associated protein Cas5/CasD [Actinokineospora sp. NBRC 105648]GLZ38734.1 type I-E CRISPR-associated protein Cas5/CasD [Actinokineospora sp. NBRC 105648]
MTALVLRLAAPLQSWGTSSRFTRRGTDLAPSRSGVIGLLAAAKGLSRVDPLDELRDLRIGVRVEQAGQLERDFQTARTRDGSRSMPLSYRFYLADAVFVVAVEGATTLLDDLAAALRRPAFPLFLGRRSCPPAGKLLVGMATGDIKQALTGTPWLASPAIRRRHAASQVRLDTVLDCPPGTPGSDTVRDDPISFDPRHRQYGWRTVHRVPITVPNPDHRPGHDPHDPMDLLECT